MNPFDLRTRRTVAPPVFLTERVKTVGNIAKRTASGSRDLADGIRDLTKHSEISVVDSKDRSVTKALRVSRCVRSHIRTVVAPAGRFEDVTHLIAPCFCATNITPHRAVFPKATCITL